MEISENFVEERDCFRVEEAGAGAERALAAPTAGSRCTARTANFLDGSFSAVWTATIASKDAFFSIFQNLQDLHPFAPF